MGNNLAKDTIQQVIIKGTDVSLDLHQIEQYGIPIKYLKTPRSPETLDLDNMAEHIKYDIVPLNCIMVKIIDGDIAGSKEFVYGISFIDQRSVYISVKRLKQQYYDANEIKDYVNFYGKTPDELVFSKYTEAQLLQYLLIHEIGHVLTNRSYHCTDKNCVMHRVRSIVDLTKPPDYCSSCSNIILSNTC